MILTFANVPFDSVEFEIAGSNTTHPVDNFNKVLFVLPAGRAPGLYDIELVSSIGCRGVANQVIGLADTTTVVVTGVEPAFVYAEEGGGVRVDVGGGASLENGVLVCKYCLRVGVSTLANDCCKKIVDLSPTTARPTDVAVELGSQLFESVSTLTGIVPKAAIGEYDVIIVNPSRTVGVRRAGL
jgi:hypothetical protein